MFELKDSVKKNIEIETLELKTKLNISLDRLKKEIERDGEG